MRIISKFRDYYDIALGDGHDDYVTFVRKTEEIGEKLQSNWHRTQDHRTKRLLVGFCGKVHPLVILTEGGWGDQKSYYCYTPEALEKARLEMGLDNPKKSKYYRWNKWREQSHGLDADFHFLIKDRDPNKHADLFIEHKTPCWVKTIGCWGYGGYHELVINPCLKDLKFFKMVDAYTAFQEIDMYIGGVLGQANADTVEVADEYRLAGHGYDKHSFRMDKDSKPNRKNR